MRDPRCIGEGDPVGTLIIKRYDIFNRQYASKRAKELPLWVPDLSDLSSGADASSESQSTSISLPSLKNHPLQVRQRPSLNV